MAARGLAGLDGLEDLLPHVRSLGRGDRVRVNVYTHICGPVIRVATPPPNGMVSLTLFPELSAFSWLCSRHLYLQQVFQQGSMI